MQVVGTAEIRILALGGTLRPSSSGASALRVCLETAEQMGCSASLLTGADLDLPIYDPNSTKRTPKVCNLLAAVRAANALLIASPGYHASVSGMVKNALDYLEDLRPDSRCYLHDMPVGCIVSAAGWQAGGPTLAALRAIVHALRGWPTPMGVIFNSTARVFSTDGACTDDGLARDLLELTHQVIRMARMQCAYSNTAHAPNTVLSLSETARNPEVL